MPNVTIDDDKGLLVQKGSGLNINGAATVGGTLTANGAVSTLSTVSNTFLPTAVSQAKTANATIVNPGLYTFSSLADILTGTMPAAGLVPGGTFIFRSLGTFGHILTGSAETQGTQAFRGRISGSSEIQTAGTKLTLPTIGSSVVLMSDGLNFLVLAQSGSISISDN